MERLTRLGGRPLLIFDEAENIRPQTAGRIKALYDQLRRHDQGALCGFALMGTPDLAEYWEKAAGKQSPGAIQFSRRLLRRNTFAVPEKIGSRQLLRGARHRRSKIAAGTAARGGIRSCGEHPPRTGTLRGQVENARLVRALQAIIRRQKPHRPMSPAVHPSITKPKYASLGTITAGERRQCTGTQGAFRVIFHRGADEKPAYDACARSGADD